MKALLFIAVFYAGLSSACPILVGEYKNCHSTISSKNFSLTVKQHTGPNGDFFIFLSKYEGQTYPEKESFIVDGKVQIENYEDESEASKKKKMSSCVGNALVVQVTSTQEILEEENTMDVQQLYIRKIGRRLLTNATGVSGQGQYEYTITCE